MYSPHVAPTSQYVTFVKRIVSAKNIRGVLTHARARAANELRGGEWAGYSHAFEAAELQRVLRDAIPSLVDEYAAMDISGDGIDVLVHNTNTRLVMRLCDYLVSRAHRTRRAYDKLQRRRPTVPRAAVTDRFVDESDWAGEHASRQPGGGVYSL